MPGEGNLPAVGVARSRARGRFLERLRRNWRQGRLWGATIALCSRLAMAKSLNIRLIAEGVETEDQRAFLEKHGCDEGRGYLFSRPVPAHDCAALMRLNAIAPVRRQRGATSFLPGRQGRLLDKA